MSKPKAPKRDFDGLWEECLSMIKKDPMPPYPELPLKQKTLSPDNLDSFAKGESEFGYPLTELFLNPYTVRLLIEKNDRVKYDHYIRTHFLGTLRLLEESAALPINYRVSISDIINSPIFPSVSVQKAKQAMTAVKSLIRGHLGFEFERDTSSIRFVSQESVFKSRYFYDHHIHKGGARAQQLNREAFTRGALGDVEMSKVPDDIAQSITKGEEAYRARYLGDEKRTFLPAVSIPRHLL
jgi:hypothetical protein